MSIIKSNASVKAPMFYTHRSRRAVTGVMTSQL